MKKNILDIADASKLLDVCRQTIKVWIQAGDLRFIKVGREYFFKRTYLKNLKRYKRRKKES